MRCQKSVSVGAFVAGCRWCLNVDVDVDVDMDMRFGVGLHDRMLFPLSQARVCQAACALWLVCWWCEMLSISREQYRYFAMDGRSFCSMDNQTKEQQYCKALG